MTSAELALSCTMGIYGNIIPDDLMVTANAEETPEENTSTDETFPDLEYTNQSGEDRTYNDLDRFIDYDQANFIDDLPF